MRTVIVIPDLHIRCKSGGEDKRSIQLVENYMQDYKNQWDEVIYLGDILDMNSISTHNVNNLRSVEGETLFADYSAGYEFLKRQKKLAPNAKFTLISGNHDGGRIERYIDANPMFQGTLEVPKGLHLEELGINYVDYWCKGETYKVGNALFIHGLYTNEYHPKKHLQAYGTNVFYGHVHSVDSFSQVWSDTGRPIVAQSLGCLCDLKQSYMRGKPTKWAQAFATFFFLANGDFSYYVTRIINHRFVGINGKVYK